MNNKYFDGSLISVEALQMFYDGSMIKYQRAIITEYKTGLSSRICLSHKIKCNGCRIIKCQI